jgi:hypothetical protein
VTQKRCRAAYEGRLATWAAARTPALRVAYENAPFTPVTGETYLAPALLPAQTESEDLQGVLRTYLGVFQVLVSAPINSGPGAAMGVADELAALFTNNLRLTVSGLTVQQITPASVAPALQDESRYIVPVSFTYRADI